MFDHQSQRQVPHTLEAVKDASPMASAFDQLAGLQSHTGDLIAHLETRLIPVLGPEAVTDAAKPGGYTGTCQLHELTLDAIGLQRRLNDSLQAVIDRIAL